MNRFARQLVLGIFFAIGAFFLFATTPVYALCDGWASPGTTHRNNGNGCYYTCSGDSWSGPTKCDGGGDGECQGCQNASKEDAARAVKQRQKEAEKKIEEQGGLNSEETKKVRRETQQKYGQSALNSSAAPRDEDTAATELAVVGQECDPNSGSAGTVGPGGRCCIGGVVECSADTNGVCGGGIDRFGTYGVCGTKPRCGDGFASVHECSAPNVCPRDYKYCAEQGFEQPAEETVEQKTEEYHRERFDELTQECLFGEDELLEGNLNADCVGQLSRTTQILTDEGADESELENLVERRRTLGNYYTAVYRAAQAETLCGGDSQACAEARSAANAEVARTEIAVTQAFSKSVVNKAKRSAEKYKEQVQTFTQERVAKSSDLPTTMRSITQKCAAESSADAQERCLRVQLRVQLGLDLDDSGQFVQAEDSTYYQQFCDAAVVREGAGHCRQERATVAANILAQQDAIPQITVARGVCNFPGGCECEHYGIQVNEGDQCYSEGFDWVRDSAVAQQVPDCGGEGQVACGDASQVCDPGNDFHAGTNRCWQSERVRELEAQESQRDTSAPSRSEEDYIEYLDAGEEWEFSYTGNAVVCAGGSELLVNYDSRGNITTQACVSSDDLREIDENELCAATGRNGACRCSSNGAVIDAGLRCPSSSQFTADSLESCPVGNRERLTVFSETLENGIQCRLGAGLANTCRPGFEYVSGNGGARCVRIDDFSEFGQDALVSPSEQDPLVSVASDSAVLPPREEVSSSADYGDVWASPARRSVEPIVVEEITLAETYQDAQSRADSLDGCGGNEQYMCSFEINGTEVRLCKSWTRLDSVSKLCYTPERYEALRQRLTEDATAERSERQAAGYEQCSSGEVSANGCLRENGRLTGQSCVYSDSQESANTFIALIDSELCRDQQEEEQAAREARASAFVETINTLSSTVSETVTVLWTGVLGRAEAQNREQIDTLAQSAQAEQNKIATGNSVQAVARLRERYEDLSRRCGWVRTDVPTACTEVLPSLAELPWSESNETVRRTLVEERGNAFHNREVFAENTEYIVCGENENGTPYYCCPGNTLSEMNDDGGVECVSLPEQGPALPPEEPLSTAAPDGAE